MTHTKARTLYSVIPQNAILTRLDYFLDSSLHSLTPIHTIRVVNIKQQVLPTKPHKRTT
uniref:Uncharacterized protein n=1 Tax=Arundo donax TaxID=35708 RepID=A0A0A8Z3X9_ARUDO